MIEEDSSVIEGIEGTEEWMAEWRNKGDEGRVGLLLGRSVAMVKNLAHGFGTPNLPPTSLSPPKVPRFISCPLIHNTNS